ncbi:hypothetical protein [Methylocaldum gracile]|jgi:hypothetical protein|uniref:hypothetical protein n=1 Tax=unclassified Methylocaldum TaxID=2622260 RepID=UPI00105EB997
MNNVTSLIRLINNGLSTQVMLNDGGMIFGFWPHDIIARGNVEAGVVVVRGMVCVDCQPPQDRVIPLCDIGGVFSERPRQTFMADPAFFQRNPVPRGWTTIHTLLPSTVAAR